ncbi:MAG: hypothetical protein LWY06_10715 [Firmicutes bacterium]|nr:hypothetical protein [Bacillota bacterium]
MAEDSITREQEMEQMVADTMKQLAENFDALGEMRTLYQSRIIDATFFNRRFGTDRRAVGEFVGFDAVNEIDDYIKNVVKKADNPRSKKWGDIFILYMVDQSAEHLEEAYALLQEEPVGHPRIMIALPKQASFVAGNLLLYATIKKLSVEDDDAERKALWAEKCKELKSGLKGIAAWENWHWFYMGGIIEKQEDITANGVLSIFMEKLFPRTINPGLKALGYHHNLNDRDRRSVRLAIERILDFSKPLVITKDKNDAASVVLNKISELGILARVSKPGWEEIWEVKEDPAAESYIKPLWDKLYLDILSRTQKGEEVSFREVFDLFKQPPFGTSTAFLKVIFALFWRCFHFQIKLFNYGQGKRKEKNRLTFQRLVSMVKCPDRWNLGLRQELPAERKFLKTVTEIFQTDIPDEEIQDSLWEEARYKMLSWYNGLPRVIHREKYDDPVIPVFLKTIARIKGKNSREIFLNHIPDALGYSPFDPETSEPPEEFFGELTGIVAEINEKARELPEALWKELKELFNLPETDNDIRAHFDKMLKEFNADKYAHTFRGDSKILYEVMKSPGKKDLKDMLVRSLPVLMGMGSLWEWEMNRIPELIARLDKCRYQMSVMELLEFREVFDPKKRRDFIEKRILLMFRELGFSQADMEAFLEGYLEEIAG